ncbi:CHAT domain-containing protein [Streptomyces mirabilis]|uniref:CHAT domain-containing protein n=1 Tax=Streptomyces mirabilis TaxID=68239 RepID=UPI0036C25AD8
MKRGHVEPAVALLSDVLADPSLAGETDLLTAVRTNLGWALGARAEDNGSAKDWARAQNLLRTAVTETDPDLNPHAWLGAVANLGIVLFRDSGNPKRATSLEEAVDLYERAVEVVGRYDARGQQASMLNNLGNALMERPGDDREENVDRAVAAYEQALLLWTREEFPQEWALTTARLAQAICQRGRGDGRDLEHAARLYDEALTVLDREVHPVMWLRISGWRSDLPAATDGESSGKEVEFVLGELAAIDRHTAPLAWARAQHDVGLAYLQRGLRTDSVNDLNQAAEAFRAALDPDARPQGAAPVEWAQTAGCLGMTAKALGETAKAEMWLRQAVEVLEPDGPIRDVLHFAPDLAELLAQQQRWEDAIPVFRSALNALTRGFASGVLRTAREDILGRYSWLSTSAAVVMAAAGRPEEAVQTLEQGRARLLTETLRRQTPNAAQGEDHAEFDAAAAALARAEDASNRLAAERYQGVEEERHHARAQANVRAELRAARAAFDLALSRLPAEQLSTSVPDQALVYFVANTRTTPVALIVTSEGIDTALGTLPGTELQNTLRDLLSAQRGNRARLDDILSKAGRQLGDDIVGPVAERLRALRATAVTLIPCGLLSAFPLHAAEYTYGDVGERRFLLDEFTLTYAPSATVLAHALAASRERKQAEISALVITDPDASLDSAAAEAEPLRTAADTVKNLPDATSRAVLDAGATATHLHFSGHARTLADDPLRSHLQMGPGRRLTLLDLLEGTSWPHLRLVVASACDRDDGQREDPGRSHRAARRFPRHGRASLPRHALVRERLPLSPADEPVLRTHPR